MGTHRPGIPQPGWSVASSSGRRRAYNPLGLPSRPSAEGGWEALPPWQLAPPGSGLRAQGGASRGGWDLSSGARVQRCLVWVLRNSRSWVGVKGVPFLDAESSNGDGPACLSGLVADSPQDSSVVIKELRGRKGKENARHMPYQRAIGTV